MVGSFGLRPYQTMGTRALRLAQELVQIGHQVTIIMPPWQTPEEQDRNWIERGVRIHYVRLRFGPLAQTWRMIRIIHSLKPDVLHGFKPKGHVGIVLLWFWLVAKHRMRIVLDTDDWEGRGGWNDLAGYSVWLKKIFAWQEIVGLRSAHAVTVASVALLHEVARIRGAEAHICYVPNGSGIQAPVATKGLKKYDIVVYSRFFEFSIERLFTTLRLIESLRPKTSILFIGAPLRSVDAAILDRLVHEQPLGENITRAGWVEREQLAGLLQSARCAIYLLDDTFLNATKCPVKLVDLLTVGLPVVADRVGEAASMIHDGQTGLLVHSGNSEAMASATVRLLNDQNFAEQLGQAAQNDVQRLSWSVSAQKISHLYASHQ